MQPRESLILRLKNILPARIQHRRKTPLVIGAALLVGGVAVGGLINISDPAKSARTPMISVEEDYLDSPGYGLSETLVSPAPDADKAEPDLREIRIKAGQGMMEILIRNGADRQDADKAIKALADYSDLRKLQIGQTLQALYDSRGRLTGLNIPRNFDHMIRVRRTNDRFTATVQDLPSVKLTRHMEGVIKDSLFLSAARAGLPDNVIVNLIRIFSFDVDFQREIRTGDRFEILYERKMSRDGRRVEEGHILFARLILHNRPISLYRYKAVTSPFADYFHENGRSAKKMLMKTPIEGARLSSHYGRRKHPVLGYTRMHKGLDFSAPTGTPIMAAGDGIVERASRYGSYGNYVRIRHNSAYKTAYAHMSRYGRGIKSGRRVRQGQIIGYVGATGRVTGRHLHYEVLVNGRQVNPLRLKIPTGITLTGKDRQKFLTLAGDVDQQILALKHNILLSRNQKTMPDEAGASASLPIPLSP